MDRTAALRRSLSTLLLCALAGCPTAPPAASAFPCRDEADCAQGNACVESKCVPRGDGENGAGLRDGGAEGEGEGETDAGRSDAGRLDAGLLDSGTLDSGAFDSGTMDAGRGDSGPLDSGTTDSGTTDSGTTDSGTTDSGTTDSGTFDSGPVDAGVDAGPVDAGPCPDGTDDDGDGYGAGCPLGGDCDDGDDGVSLALTVAVDADGDGYTFGPSFLACTAGEPPDGTAPPSSTDDCDETDDEVHEGCGSCVRRPFNDRVWLACSSPLDRTPAKDACESDDLFLASLHSQAEADFVAQTLTHLGLANRVWIGLREGYPGTRWDDGSAVDFYDFPAGATSGGSWGEDCANIVGVTSWDDDDCGGHVFPYLCASAPEGD